MIRGRNWEKSKALTSLKCNLLKEIFSIPTTFFLTGGSALGIFYLNHRLSRGLDFITVLNVDWHVISDEFVHICNKIGAEAELTSASLSFRRYTVRCNGESEKVLFLCDMIDQVSPQKKSFSGIIVDTLLEITINKWCSLLRRSNTIDIVDLYFLQKKIDIWNAFELACQKDEGLDPSMIAFLVSHIKIVEIPNCIFSTVKNEHLNMFVGQVREFLDERSFPEFD